MRKIPQPILNIFSNGLTFLLIGLTGLFFPNAIVTIASFLGLILDLVLLFIKLTVKYPFGWYLFMVGGIMLDILAVGAYYEWKKEKAGKAETPRTKTSRRLR